MPDKVPTVADNLEPLHARLMFHRTLALDEPIPAERIAIYFGSTLIRLQMAIERGWIHPHSWKPRKPGEPRYVTDAYFTKRQFPQIRDAFDKVKKLTYWEVGKLFCRTR